jgi:hypothetical protein
VWAEALTLFVAVSSAGLVMTSPDGITWTQRTAAAANAWTGLVWSPALTLLVAVSSNGASQVMTSPDGITWTSRTAAAARTWRGVAWSPSLTLFVACALGGGVNCVMTSPDGITWTQRTTPSTGYNAVAWSAELGRFVVVGGAVGVGVAATSPDGVTWTAQITANGNTWEDLIWVPEMGLFVAVSSDGLSSSENRVMASEDGLAWSAYRTPAVGAWFAVAWGPGRLVAVGITTGAVAQIMAVAPPTYDTLVGIPPSGAGSIVVPLVSGAPVHIWVQRDDLAAQAERIAIDLAQGRVSDGVIEGPIIRDERRGEASLVLRLDADLAQFSRPIVTVTYATRDVKTKSGKTIHIDLASPPIGPIDLTIQSATISQIGIVVGVKPRYDVTASSLRFSVDDVLRQLVAARASVA